MDLRTPFVSVIESIYASDDKDINHRNQYDGAPRRM